MFLFSKSKYHKFSDKQLLEEYKSSNRQKFIAELFNRYAHLIYGVCIKFENRKTNCKDVVIVVFEKLMQEAKIKEIKSLKSWLYIVTRNECLQNNNKQNKIIAENNNLENYNSAKDAENKIPDSVVKSSIRELKDEQRICIEHFYFNKKSYSEIAKITNYNIKNIKSYIQNGKRNLKIIIEKNTNN